MNPGARAHEAQNSKVCTWAAGHTLQLQSQAWMWPCSTVLKVQQHLKFRYARRRKDVSALKLCPHLTLYFKPLS